MKQHIATLTLVLAACMLPGTVSAYYTTDQDAVAIGKNVGMFLIDYQFGLADEALYMPVFGERNLAHNAATGDLGYEILEDADERTSVGETAGIVLSDADIRDGMYYVPAGEARRFTFVAFLVLPQDSPELDAALHVTELPFYVGENKRAEKLNEPELQYYMTEEIELNEGVETDSTIVTGKQIKLQITDRSVE